MIEKYLGKQQAEDIFYASMLTGLMTEKQAEDFVEHMEKEAWVDTAKNIGSSILGGLKTLGRGATTAFSEVPKGLGWIMLLGAGSGILGANAYDIVKEHVTHEDPEAKFNAEMEAMYKSRKREIEDAKWMARARAKRDELKRGLKKMTTKEYANEYKKLMDILDERKAV